MIILTIIITNSILTLPQILINSCGASTLLNCIFISILAIFITLLITKLFKNFPALDIIDISNYVGGKIFQKIIGIIFILYFISTSAILLRNFCESLKIIYYPNTQIIFILLLFIISLIISNSTIKKSNLKISIIITPIAFISIIILFIALTKHFSYENIFPILGNGFSNTFILGITNIFAFSGIAFIYFLPPILEHPENFKKISLISIILSSIFLLITLSTIIFMFSFSATNNEIMPLYLAAKTINFGSFFQRLESIYLFIWIITFIAFLNISLHFSSIIFKKIFNLENKEMISIPLCFLIFGISLIPQNYSETLFYEKTILKYIIIFFIFVFNIFLLILANIKQKRKKQVGRTYE